MICRTHLKIMFGFWFPCQRPEGGQPFGTTNHIIMFWFLDHTRFKPPFLLLRTEKSIGLPNGISLKCSISHGGHLRVISMPAKDARGPCWARYLAQLLWEKEDLYLQLDSHMRFVPSWDHKARLQLKSCRERSGKPILCSYGRAYQHGTPYHMAPQNITGCLNCAAFFDQHDILNIRYRALQKNWDEPRPSFFWSAHFSFSLAVSFLQEVPYDPRLLMLFFGEEILMTVRCFTHGWDLFSPSEGLVFHLWQRDYRRVYAEDMKVLLLRQNIDKDEA